MDEPIKNYPEYPATVKALCVTALLLVVAGATGVALYRMADGNNPKRAVQRTDQPIQRTDPNIGAAKRFERVPSPPERIGLQ